MYQSLCLIILLILLSCSSSPLPEKDIRIVLIDSVSFEINDHISTQTKALFYHEESGKRFFVYNDENWNFIRVFDLDSHNKFLDIQLPITVDGVSIHTYGFFLKSLDSIYLPIDGSKIILINKSGNILRQIDYSDLIFEYPNLYYISSFSRFTKEAINKGDYIYFIQNESRLDFQENSTPSDYKFCFRYNLKTDVVSLMNISLPNSFWKEGIRQMSMSMVYDERRFIYAPLYSNDIYISEDNMEINNHYYVKSAYVDNLNNYFPTNNVPSYDEYSYTYCTSQYYIGLLWDKYRQVYYRFFWPGIDTVTAKDKVLVSKIFHNNPNYGIMVLDENFQILDELVLPKNIYTWDKYFVAKEGLYLSADYSENQISNINTWTFHIYQPISLKSEEKTTKH